MQLNEIVVLITGAKGGLGTFVTNAFLDAGATVIGVSRSIADSDFRHPNFSGIPAELGNGDEARKLVEAVTAKRGRIDALVHLVGGFAGGSPVAETDDAVFDRMIDMNLRSAFHVMRAVLPQMRNRGSGRIIALGSKAAVEPAPLAGVYAASKAALVSLIRTIARENSDRGITANAVLPGTMDTPANRSSMPNVDPKTWVQPNDVADAIFALVNDLSGQITGAMVPVYARNI
jgi:NAD(P)-dependent dehydrogenase (short-subunit alcohol dehydrogenase family)